MALQRHARKADDSRQAVSDIWNPGTRVPLCEDCGDRECGNRMAGREAPDTSDPASLRLLEPGIGKISVFRNFPGIQTASCVFHHGCEDLRAKNSFTRQQECSLCIGIPACQANSI